MFDRVVCISLARRSERWDQFLHGLPSDWPFARPKRVRAVDGHMAKPPTAFLPSTIGLAPQLQLAGLIPPALVGHHGVRMAGVWGCYRSHLRVIEDALTDDCDSVLVFEDDAIFGQRFAQRVERFLSGVPSDWDQIYLGGQHLNTDTSPPEAVNETVLRCHSVNRTHAYALRRTALLDLYQMLSVLPDDPQDAQDLHVDHRLGRWHASNNWNIYAPHQWLVGQRAGDSDTGGLSHKCQTGAWWNDFPIAEGVAC